MRSSRWRRSPSSCAAAGAAIAAARINAAAVPDHF